MLLIGVVKEDRVEAWAFAVVVAIILLNLLPTTMISKQWCTGCEIELCLRAFYGSVQGLIVGSDAARRFNEDKNSWRYISSRSSGGGKALECR